MTNQPNDPAEAARAAAPCSLREACARAGLDRGGQRCPACPVRELCQSEVRWLVRSSPLH